MRVELEKKAWILDEIGEVEWFMLSQLPESADFTRSEKARSRILPEVCDDEDVAADWRDYARPELEARFRDEIRVVAADLRRVEELLKKGKSGSQFRLKVPVEHAETWYGVLNQARLILNEDHEVVETEVSLMSGELVPTAIEEQQWLIMVQYRIYGALQEFLLTHLMESP
jgi:uncharacterized protein YecA (UPF0149 family)